MSAESLRERVAEALVEHGSTGWRWSGSSQLVYSCQCGDHYAAIGRYTVAHPDDIEGSAEWHRQHLADAVLAVLGEVTVAEEWTCVVDACDTCGPRRRRTVVTTRRVGEWEVAE